MDKNILITGCSSGIGYHTAKLLHGMGYNVMACCRKNNDIERLESEGIACTLLDLNDSHSIQIGFEQVLEKFGGKIDILINNAAYAQAGAVEDLSRNELRAQFETNVFGLSELSNMTIKVMRQQNSGTILNIGSILGIVAIPFKGAYVASKFALEGLTDALRLELSDTPLNVILLDPGPVDTKFRSNAKNQFKQTFQDKESHFNQVYDNVLNKTGEEKLTLAASSEKVARRISDILKHKYPKPRYFVTLPAYALMIARRLLPTRLLDKILKRIV